MTPTPCKPDVIALAERLEKFQCVLESAQRQDNKIISVWSDDPVVVAEAVQTLRHLASQPSLYEAGREKGARYRHVKRGGIYRVVGRAQVQADDPLTDYEIVTVYRDQDGELWVRRKSEFEDGRFEPVEDSFAALPADVGAPDDGSCVRCSAVPRTASGLCNTCLDEDAERAGEIATPSTAGSVREALDWPKIEHPHRPDEASYEKIQLKEKLKKFGPEIVAQTIFNYALALPKQGSFAGSLWAIAEWLTAALSAPVEAPVAGKRPVLVDDQNSASGKRVEWHTNPRPLPSVDEVAETIWRAEYLRATGRDRSLPWAEAISECDRNRYRFVATAILTLLGGSAHGR
ncbi:hypothetical protein ACSVBT_06875 [Afipia sp. TerB]